jgi:diguanylate cyclase (GGDEF)-like protein
MPTDDLLTESPPKHSLSQRPPRFEWIVAAIGLGFALVLALAAFTALWTADQIDRSDLLTQQAHVRRALADERETVRVELQRAANDSDVARVVRAGQLFEINRLLVKRLQSGAADAVIVLDKSGGVMVAQVRDSDEIEEAKRFVAAHKAQLLDEQGRTLVDLTPALVRYDRFGEAPVIIAMAAVTNLFGWRVQSADEVPVVISIAHLDAPRAQRMERLQAIPLGAFGFGRITESDTAIAIGETGDAAPITQFRWKPNRIGAKVIAAITPLSAVFSVTILAAMSFLSLWLCRSLRKIEIQRAEALRAADEDSLTGLLSRRRLLTELEELAKMPARTRHHLMLLDLDDFKAINDTHGHPAGDETLRIVAERMRIELPPAARIARLGGDEFAVALPEGEADISGMGARLILKVNQPIQLSTGPVHVGVSIGAVSIESGVSATELIRRADVALYASKSDGRNRLTIHTDVLSAQAQHSSALANDLNDAISDNTQIFVVYQPLIQADGITVTGYECLARWTHPRLGPVGPAEFIPLAIQSGLVDRLSDELIRQALTFQGLGARQRLSINISPRRIRTCEFIAAFDTLVAASPLRFDQIEIEITEDAVLQSGPVVRDNLARLRERGVSIALDDFGTGYSAMDYLRQHMVDRIKIDRSFVEQIEADRGSLGIVKAMVEVAQALDLGVTAEGVETTRQFEILRDFGCDTFQGYLFGRPQRREHDPSPVALRAS